MRRGLWLLIALVFMSSTAFAEESANKKFLEWHMRDLYYYDSKDTIVRLELAPKLLVRFTKELTAEERVSFFSEFSPIAQRPEPNDPFSFILDFNNSTKPHALLEIANKLARSGFVITSPVFFIENVEAIIEGVAIEPKIVLTAERLFERMKKYGDFSSRKTEYKNRAWVFLTDEVRPPLNLLVFTNLIKNDSWVRRAYPYFRFLNDPITAFVTVEPVSGTVGEVRTAILTIKIFDTDITLLENELPKFGDGLFSPMRGILSSPSTMKHPPGYLFERIGGLVIAPVKQEKRSRTYVFSQRFKFGALGEWIIHPQTVGYTKKDDTREIKSSGFTLIVNSQVGNLKIDDMPYPRLLSYSTKVPKVVAKPMLPDIPPYWFDSWMFKKDYEFIKYGRLSSLLLGMVVITILAMLIINSIKIIVRKTTLRGLLIKEVREIIDKASVDRSYTGYSDALSLILKGIAPSFSSHPIWEEVKGNERVLRTFNEKEFELLEEIFIELGRRHMRDFMPSNDDLMKLDKNIRIIFEATSSHFTLPEEA